MNKRKCHFKGCEEIGEYRAPSSPKDLGKYIWFCLKHIKEYNKKWNYFSDMTADEIEAFIENDIIGHRKTKQIGSNDTSYFEKISILLDIKKLTLFVNFINPQLNYLNIPIPLKLLRTDLDIKYLKSLS